MTSDDNESTWWDEKNRFKQKKDVNVNASVESFSSFKTIFPCNNFVKICHFS